MERLCARVECASFKKICLLESVTSHRRYERVRETEEESKETDQRRARTGERHRANRGKWHKEGMVSEAENDGW